MCKNPLFPAMAFYSTHDETDSNTQYIVLDQMDLYSLLQNNVDCTSEDIDVASMVANIPDDANVVTEMEILESSCDQPDKHTGNDSLQMRKETCYRQKETCVKAKNDDGGKQNEKKEKKKQQRKKKTVTFSPSTPITTTTNGDKEKQPRLAAETARVRMNMAVSDECSLPLATVTQSSSIDTEENPPTPKSKNIEKKNGDSDGKKTRTKKIKTSTFDKMRARISDCRIDLLMEGKAILKSSKFDTELRSRNVNLARHQASIIGKMGELYQLCDKQEECVDEIERIIRSSLHPDELDTGCLNEKDLTFKKRKEAFSEVVVENVYKRQKNDYMEKSITAQRDSVIDHVPANRENYAKQTCSKQMQNLHEMFKTYVWMSNHSLINAKLDLPAARKQEDLTRFLNDVKAKSEANFQSFVRFLAQVAKMRYNVFHAVAEGKLEESVMPETNKKHARYVLEKAPKFIVKS